MFKWRAGGLFVVHIPYRGTGLVISDLIAGQITFLMDSIVSAQSHIREGRVRALAVTGAQRSASLPQVPTFAELGVPGMAFSNWFGFFAPAGTPGEIVDRLNRELNAIVRSPEVQERLRSLGADDAGGTPQQFARVFRDEHDSWKAVIQRAGIKAERAGRCVGRRTGWSGHWKVYSMRERTHANQHRDRRRAHGPGPQGLGGKNQERGGRAGVEDAAAAQPTGQGAPPEGQGEVGR
jgi:hypothetical protein